MRFRGYRRVCTVVLLVTLLLGLLPEAALAITLPGALPVANPDSYTAISDVGASPLVAAAPGVLANDSGFGLTAIAPSTPAHGTVTLNPNGGFTYTPTTNFVGTDTFTYKAHNGSGDSAPTTVTIAVSHANVAPSFTKGPDVTVLEGAGPQNIANWATAISPGPPEESTQTVAFQVTNNTNTALFAAAPAVSPTGTLTFTAASGMSGAATITLVAMDNGGTANGGHDTSAPQTFTITVTAVNQQPTINAIPDPTAVPENAGAQTVNLSGIGPGAGDPVQALTVTATSNNPAVIPNPTVTYTSPNATGSLSYTPVANTFGTAVITVTVQDNGGTANGGVDTTTRTFTVTVTRVNQQPTLDVIPDPASIPENSPAQTVNLTGIGPGAGDSGQTLTVTATSGNTALIPNPTVTYTSPQALGSLSYTPVAGQFGTAVITVTVQDNGGTANGGVDTRTRTFTVTVAQNNQPPTINVIADPAAILENAGAQSVNLSGIGPGVGDPAQILTVTATSGNTGLIPNPTVTYTSPNATGSLAYTPAANQFGTALITVTVKDNGGTANGGVDTTVRTFTVTVARVNQQPTLDVIPDPAPIAQNAPAQTVNLAGISAGAGDSDQSIVVTATSDNTALIPNPTVTYTNPNPTGSLSYTPVAGQFGTAHITVTVTDNGGGANGGLDTRTRTFTVLVNQVNQAPTIDAIPDPAAILENTATPQTVNLTGISAGAGESGQTITVTATSGNPALIPNPTVTYTSPNASGSLAYTPVPNTFGTAVITVTVKDNAGTGGGGIDTTTRTFTVTVTRVNQAPTLDVIPNQASVPDTAGVQNVSLSGISAGPGDGDQSIVVTATSDTPSLVANPTITYTSPQATGTLHYTPTLNQNGTAIITVTVMDSGDTSNGGINTTIRTFTVTITHTNVAPQITKPAATQNVNENATLTFTSGGGNAISVSDADAGTAAITVTLGVLHGALHVVLAGGAAISAGANDSANITLTGSQADLTATLSGMVYTPTTGYSGPETLSIGANDNGHTGSGGAQTASATVTINVINQAPQVIASPKESFDTVGNTAFEFKATQSLAPSVFVAGNLVANFTDPEGDALSVASIPGCTDVTAPFDCPTANGGTVSLAANGEFTFLPKAGFVGDDTFQYQITDGHSNTVTRTVTVHITNMVWYINSANGGAADGRSASPFTSTASVNAVSSTGDTIFVYQGTYTGGLALKDNQPVFGQPAGLTVASHTLVAAGGTRPVIGNTAGNGITLGAGNSIDQVDLGASSGLALSGTAAGTLTINHMTINNTAGGCVSIGGGALTITLDSLACTGGTYGINLANDTGSFTVTNAAGSAISGATTAGVNVDQNTVSLTFPGTVTSTSSARSVSVSNKTGGVVTLGGLITDTGTGIALTNNTGATIHLDGGLTLTTAAAATALTATGGGTITATGTNSINAAGQALNLSGVTFSTTFTGISSGGGTSNIAIANVTGTLALGSGALSGASGTAFNVNGGNPTVTYTGTIASASSTRSVAVASMTGGSVTLSGAITDNGAGIALTNNAGATINLTGGVTLNTTTHNAFTANGPGPAATSGGTIKVTGTNNTIATTTGTALNVANTTIDAAGLTFKSIAANGSVNGIILNNTGTNGGLTVTGNHPSDPANTTRGNTTAGVGGPIAAGDGGTIQNTSGSGIILINTKSVILRSVKVLNAGGATVNSGNNGITATTITGLTLDNVLITGSTGNSGLRGTAVTDLALQHVDIDGNGTAVGIDQNNNWNVHLDDLGGNCGDVTNGCPWQNSLFFNSRATVVGLNQGVTNTTVSVTFTITNSEFRDTTTSAPGIDAFLLTANRAAVTNLTVTGSTFKNAWVTGFQYIGNEESSGTVNVRNSVFDLNGTDINISHQNANPSTGTVLNFDVSSNTTRQVLAAGSSDSIVIFLAGNSKSGSSMIGKLTNNTVGNAGVANSGSVTGNGIQVNSTGIGTITATVTGNNVREVGNGSAFFAEINSGPANMNLKMHSNHFEANALGFAGIELVAGTGSVGDTGTMFLDIGAPSVPGGSAGLNTALGPSSNGVRLKALSTTHVNVLGYGGADNNDGLVAAYIGTGGGGGNTLVNPAPSVFHSPTATIHGVTTNPVTFP